MFNHIVVPLDLSQRNKQAVATARALAVRLGARVTLLHVVQKLASMPGVRRRPSIGGSPSCPSVD